MFETQTNDNAKTPPETKPQQDIADDGKEAPRPNPLWQSLALRPAALQPKPAIRQSDDPHERDAGQVAERVTRLATSPLSYKQLSFKSAPPTAQRKCASCTDEEGIRLQREEANVSLSS